MNDATQLIDDEVIEQTELQETVDLYNNVITKKAVSTPKKQKGFQNVLKPKGAINYLDKNRADQLVNTIDNIKHKTAILIMLDCGLRVSECVSLQLKNFDFKKKVILVRSLKKRGDELVRQIPISQRLLETLAAYLKQLKPKDEESYLFPGTGGNAHISRKALNIFCDRLKQKNPAFAQLHPHALRHTFATQLLASGTELHNVKTMLGHKNLDTTLIYNHTPLEILRQNIDNATRTNESFLKKCYNKLFKKPFTGIINFSSNPQNFLVGRDAELLKLVDNLNKNINTILIGKIGVGKSHLLKQLDFKDRKLLKLDEMTNLKMTFVNLLLYLYEGDKEAIKNLIFPAFDKTQIQQKLQKDSVHSLIEEIIKITTPHEYILMIDNVDGITAKGMKCIELLKDHFTIVTTAREVPISKANFLWNFERIEVENLARTASLELIHRLSYDMDIEDFELYRNHIYDQSSGNPRVIYELCERYRKELVITDDVVRSVRHIGGIPEIDMSFIIVFILAGISILRYTSREIGGTNLRFIGGMALVLLMLSRFFLSKMKRKFI